MIFPALFFYLFAGVCVASAVMVIVSRNPVHSVLFLILAFVNAAGLFVLMGAEFVGMVLIFVYVGVAKAITAAIPANVSNTEALGLVLYTKYIYYFQIAGMVLLVAMIGAIVLTLRHKASVKRQDINVQNARTPELAMSVRQVASGQGLLDTDAAEWVK